MARSQSIRNAALSKATLSAPYDSPRQQAKQPNQQTINQPNKSNKSRSQKRHSTTDGRRSLPKNFILKRLDILYWKRLLRYLYVRFLRIRSSPKAIARGAAAGAFAGAFPLLGLQSIFGLAIASCIRGSKVVAVASTWISNPLTYVPIFALNFHIGRTLLRLPPTEMPDSAVGIDVWMSMGIGVGAALMLGSLITGVILGAIAYYVGLRVAKRVQSRRYRKKP